MQKRRSVITNLGHQRLTKSTFSTKHDWAEHPKGVFTCSSCGDGSYLISLSTLQRFENASAQDELPDGWIDQVPFWIYPSSFHFVFSCPGCRSTVAAYVRVHDTQLHGRQYEVQWIQVGPQQLSDA
jgi:hypothetical protein